jgi:hypothetical protein
MLKSDQSHMGVCRQTLASFRLDGVEPRNLDRFIRNLDRSARKLDRCIRNLDRSARNLDRVILKCGPFHSLSGPICSQCGPTHSQCGPRHSQSGPIHSQSGPIHSQCGPGPTFPQCKPIHSPNPSGDADVLLANSRALKAYSHTVQELVNKFVITKICPRRSQFHVFKKFEALGMPKFSWVPQILPNPTKKINRGTGQATFLAK